MTFLNTPPPFGAVQDLLQPTPDYVRWTGISGAIYAFEIHPIWTRYKERPGVYIFCKRRSHVQWDAFYVGETDNFNRRLFDELLSHHRWGCVRAAGATDICTLHVPSGYAERLRIETDLRQALNPSCNMQ
jgi:hypothetical protein